MIYRNIRGLYPINNPTKINLLSDLCQDENVYLMCLTETHLNKNIETYEIALDGFDCIRCDRNGRIGGGVGCYIKNTLTPTYTLPFCNLYC